MMMCILCVYDVYVMCIWCVYNVYMMCMMCIWYVYDMYMMYKITVIKVKCVYISKIKTSEANMNSILMFQHIILLLLLLIRIFYRPRINWNSHGVKNCIFSCIIVIKSYNIKGGDILYIITYLHIIHITHIFHNIYIF